MNDSQQRIVYLVDVKSGRMLAYNDDQELARQVERTGIPIDPEGERNIRISLAYGNEIW